MNDLALSQLDSIGQQAYDLITRLFPICRSITGDGTRETLRILCEHIPLRTCEIPSGTPAFDWQVPKEWKIRDAYILDPQGNKIVDFKRSNLHVVGYSIPVCGQFSLADLDKHLYSLPEQPDAIPYVTSYYQEKWGFCLSHNDRMKLREGMYSVLIDSELFEGALTYGELLIPGETKSEIFLSTYICHPSMANNELSGPAVTTFLAKWIATSPRKYTYRIIFIPETIGSIAYLSMHLSEMKEKIVAGFNVTCVGDDRAYSFLPSRYGNTLADKVALNVLRALHPNFRAYSFLERRSDERQYCSPHVDLPIVSIMRSKYGTYPEYHTSLDDLALISPSGLRGAYNVLRECIDVLEHNERWQSVHCCEPQLSKRGLYPSLSTTSTKAAVQHMMDVLSYADGTNDLIDLSNIMSVPFRQLLPLIEILQANSLIVPTEGKPLAQSNQDKQRLI